MPQKAYISYARQDERIAQRLAQELRDRGLTVFQADRAIAPGESWAARLQEEIAGSDLVFPIISRSSEKSEFFASETALALAEAQKGKTVVIPVLAERGAELPYFLRRIQALDFTEPDSENTQRLLDSLLRFSRNDKTQSPDSFARDAAAQLEALRSSKHSLDVEKAILTERRALWSSTVAVAVGVLSTVLAALAGFLTLSDFKTFFKNGSDLQFILGVLFGIASSGVAFWLFSRRSPDRSRHHRGEDA